MRQPSARAARLRLDIAPSRFVVLCAGATMGPMAPRDGIDTVILACTMLREQHGVDAMLVVIGGGRDGERTGERGGDRDSDDLELARLRHLACELDVARHVRFAVRPPHAALVDYHAAADVFASTPWHASPRAAAVVASPVSCAASCTVSCAMSCAASCTVSCTVTSAMAAALPVVTGTAGAIAAMVRDGVTGYLLPPRDPDTLCRCLARLQRQPLLARAMGMAGQAHASATPHRKTPA